MNLVVMVRDKKKRQGKQARLLSKDDAATEILYYMKKSIV